MNDQRASLPQFPGLNSQAVINQYLRSRMDEDVPDDNFFEMLMRCQVCNGVSLCLLGNFCMLLLSSVGFFQNQFFFKFFQEYHKSVK